jgi:hypothetical protein
MLQIMEREDIVYLRAIDSILFEQRPRGIEVTKDEEYPNVSRRWLA